MGKPRKDKRMDEAIDTIEVTNPHRIQLPDLRHVRPSEGGEREWQYREDKVSVARALRGDPLGWMHSRQQIGHAQYHAGRRYQEEYEASGVGRIRSSGDLREHVDGGQIASDGITDRQMAAHKTLAAWRSRMGTRLTAIVEAVLIDKRTLRQISDGVRAMPGKRATRDTGSEFRRGLLIIAKAAGLG